MDRGISGMRAVVTLTALAAAFTGGCGEPVAPQPVVDVTGEYDAVLLNGRTLPLVHDSTALEWHAILSEHLSLRADRTWEVVRTDRHVRNGTSSDSTYRAASGTWNNSAGGPAYLASVGYSEPLRAALRSDTLVLSAGCATIKDCFLSSASITFVRSR